MAVNGRTDTVDFAGSEVTAVELGTAGLRVRFAAMNLRAGPVYLLGVELWLTHTTEAPPAAGCIGRLSRGSVAVDGTSTPLAVPSELHGGIELQLEFANGSQLVARGGQLTLRQQPGAGSAEHLHC